MARPYAQSLEEIKALDCATIRPHDAAVILRCDPYLLNLAAKEGKLTIKHFFAGNRLHISRMDFIRFVESGGTMPVENVVQMRRMERDIQEMKRLLETLLSMEGA